MIAIAFLAHEAPNARGLEEAAVEKKARRRKKSRACMGLVGAIGLEPTTPTMSR